MRNGQEKENTSPEHTLARDSNSLNSKTTSYLNILCKKDNYGTECARAQKPLKTPRALNASEHKIFSRLPSRERNS